MNPRIFVLVYVVGFVVLRILSRLATYRAPRRGRRGAILESSVDFREVLAMGLFLVGGLVLPLMALGPWLPQLRYTLPDWASWTGVAIMALASLLH